MGQTRGERQKKTWNSTQPIDRLEEVGWELDAARGGAGCGVVVLVVLVKCRKQDNELIEVEMTMA